MDIILIGEPDVLAALCDELVLSPEEFLLYLEAALESGELSLDEARLLIRDYNRS